MDKDYPVHYILATGNELWIVAKDQRKTILTKQYAHTHTHHILTCQMGANGSHTEVQIDFLKIKDTKPPHAQTPTQPPTTYSCTWVKYFSCPKRDVEYVSNLMWFETQKQVLRMLMLSHYNHWCIHMHNDMVYLCHE